MGRNKKIRRKRGQRGPNKRGGKNQQPMPQNGESQATGSASGGPPPATVTSQTSLNGESRGEYSTSVFDNGLPSTLAITEQVRERNREDPWRQQGGQRQQRQGGQRQWEDRSQGGGPRQQGGPPQQGGQRQWEDRRQGGQRQQQQGGSRQQGGPPPQRSQRQWEDRSHGGGQRQQGGPPPQRGQRQWEDRSQGGGHRQQGGRPQVQQRGPGGYRQQRVYSGQALGSASSQTITVNYLPVSLKDLPNTVYQYDFQIEPDKPKKMIRDAFMTFMTKNFPDFANMVAFDGLHIFYSPKPLPQKEFVDNEVTVVPEDGGKEKTFEIKIQLATEIDMRVIKEFPNDQPVSQAVQCLDVVLRAAADNPKFLRFKRSVFLLEEKKEKISNTNYEIGVGLFQSFILGSKPFLNVDISHKAFPIPLELTKLYADKSKYKYPLAEMLEGVNLIYNSPIAKRNIICKFNSIKGLANEEKFIDKNDNNKPKTVAEYFVSKIGKDFKYPGDPVCLVGKSEKNILIPLEFLKIPANQAVNRRAPDCCTSGMISFAATSTDVRKDKIMRLVSEMNYNNCEVINAFGITIDESFTEVNSHILKDREVMYKSGCATVYNGSWSIEGKGKFLIPAEAVKFGVMNLNSRYTQMPAIENFVRAMTSRSQTFGIYFETDIALIEKHECQGIPTNLENIMCKFKTDGVKLLFVIIPRDTKVYQEVKQVAELKCGILTQCIKGDTIYRKGKDSTTIDNILLKVNAKLGGINHKMVSDPAVKIKSLEGPWMVVGADVTHPSPQETTIPSVVGVAASCEIFGFKYNCEWRLQNPNDEMIRDLKDVMVSLLKKFKEANNRFPNYILYYRDGVSDGQFKEVAQVELQAIQDACKKLQMTETKVTFIVVQKRHHTRFFPTQPNSMDKNNKNNNAIPGTVVDSEIVNPLKKTFFMVSHQSLQGVAKPTKYCVLHDDAKIPSEELQMLTYNLCHLFARCNRVVSYPTPTYYAHLVAFRGRVYIHGKTINLGNLEHEFKRLRIHPDVINNNPMFFV